MDATALVYVTIGVVVLIAAIGAPLPVSGALTAAGALAAAAKLDLIALICVATLGAVAGDLLGYAVGSVCGNYLYRTPQTRIPRSFDCIGMSSACARYGRSLRGPIRCCGAAAE